MSYSKERKEKICLNCHAAIIGRYCHICGQENIEPRETFWQLTTHLIYDITHFDSKFFNTLQYLLFKPGFLTYEFISGRRASYLHPVKMYVFTSALFFVIFFAFIVNPGEALKVENNSKQSQVDALKTTITQLQDSVNRVTDVSDRRKISAQIKTLQLLTDEFESNENGIYKIDSLPGTETTAQNTRASSDSAEKEMGPGATITKFPSSLKEYDSIQESLPATERHGTFKRSLITRGYEINEKFKYNKREFLETLADKFLHSLPTMMFISLPLAALILQLLYIRHKQLLYVQHGIFLIHLYIAVFIMILILYGLQALYNKLQWDIFQWIKTIGTVLVFFYVYKAMRNFYEQRRAKTLLKYFLFHFFYFIILSLLTGIFFFNTLLNM